MSSPSVSDQGRQSSTSNGDGESSQDSTVMDAKVKDEPADSGYEQVMPAESQSNSNSRTSSPPPTSNQNETASPYQDPETSPHSSPQQQPFGENQTGPSIRSHIHGTGSTKKVDSVQNIVEGLLKKNATLLAMNDAEGLKPNSRRNKGLDYMKKGEGFGQQTVFPVSMISQARLMSSLDVAEKGDYLSKGQLLRPRSPTRRYDHIMRDETQLSYALMEAMVGDEEAENVFRVQHHELVCALSKKSFVTDEDKKILASLDNSYYWCNFCSFSSTNKEMLIRHVMDHRFRCTHCPYESFCRSDIIRHMSAAHSEMASSMESYSYCTFLSDYLRVKSRSEKLANKRPCLDPDDDVDDLDKDEMQATLLKADKRRTQDMADINNVPKKKARTEIRARNSESTDSAPADRPGKSRKSQNPRRHPQACANDYDAFEMEVEEINDYIENGNEYAGENSKLMYPSSNLGDPTPEQVGQATPSMQVVPSLHDGGNQGFTTTHVSTPAKPKAKPSPRPGPGRPPKTACPFNKARRTASTSSLYWSCGYCDFQSSSQAEIKEHSNRSHPGNPHRYKKISKERKIDQNQGTKGEEVSGTEKIVTTCSEQTPADTCSEAHSVVYIDFDERENQVCVGDLNDFDILKNDSENDGSRVDKGLNALQEQQLGNSKDTETLFKNADVVCQTKTSLVKMDNPNLLKDCPGVEIERREEPFEVDSGEGENLPPSYAEEVSISSETDSSAPLKLTFKTIGEITTCSISAKTELDSVEFPETLLSRSAQNINDINEKEIELESCLIDSSDESDFDIGSNPRSTALSVSSVSELFESVGSPCIATTIESEPEEEEEEEGERVKIDWKTTAQPPVFNENIIKLSPPCLNIPKQFPGKIPLTCVPARSAAVKAMSKMKEEVEVNEPQVVQSKKQVTKVRQSLQAKTPQNFKPAAEETVSRAPLKGPPVQSVYSCHHCSVMSAVTLSKIKAHLSNQHSGRPPIVVNIRYQKNCKKKRKLYVCLFPSCKKVFKSAIDLDYHKGESHNFSQPSKPKERKTMNSLSTSSVSTITQALRPPVSTTGSGNKRITTIDCSVKLHQLNKAQLSRYCADTEPKSTEIDGKYECLYCTESVSRSTLSEMKQHYFSEHSSQLLVMRDLEARKSQLPSRVYVCDDTSCDFRSSCRNDILSHSSCHSINATCVYECPSCGWYSSSFRVAEEHVKDVHADEENISLVRMQLSVDENGQTSKRILR